MRRRFFCHLSSHCCLRCKVRLGLSLGMVFRVGTEIRTQGGIRDTQTGRRYAYATAERSETGKSNDLCSSLVRFGFGSPDCTRTQT